MHLVYYGKFLAQDIQFINAFVSNIDTHPWFNSVNSYYNGSGTFTAGAVELVAHSIVSKAASNISSGDAFGVIESQARANGWNLLDDGALFVVMVGQSVHYVLDNTCSWHSSVGVNGSMVAFGLLITVVERAAFDRRCFPSNNNSAIT